MFVTRGETTIGKVYKKVLYREYEDGTFKNPKPHPEHLGVLGPILYGEVGDTIVVEFKNMAGRYVPLKRSERHLQKFPEIINILLLSLRLTDQFI